MSDEDDPQADEEWIMQRQVKMQNDPVGWLAEEHARASQLRAA